MDEAEYCDRVSIMSEGRIVAIDTPAELKKQYEAESVEEVFVKIARPGMKHGKESETADNKRGV
jgi:ABC-2 type transport system ATP-binding protein